MALTWAATVLFALLAGALALAATPKIASNPYLAVALPGIALLAVLTAVNNRAFFVLLLLVRPVLDPLLEFTKITVLKHEIGVGNVMNLLVLGVAGWVFLMRRRSEKTSAFFSVRWILFLAIASLSLFYSPEKAKALKLLINLSTYFALAWLPFAFVQSEGDRKFWLKVMILSSLPAVLIADAGLLAPLHLAGHPLRAWGGARLQGPFLHPNILAFYCLWAIVVVFYGLKSGALRLGFGSRVILRAYLINLAVILLATRTRSAWIACWLFFFLYGLLRERKYLAMTLAAPFLLAAVPPVRDRVLDAFSASRGRSMNSFAWRVALWRSSLESISQSPLFGRGLGSFRVLSAKFFSIERNQGAPAHNVYLEMLFETGVVGLSAYLWIFYGAIKRFWRDAWSRVAAVRTEGALAWSAVAAYLVACFSDNMLYYLTLNWSFWFFVGWALRSRELRETSA